MIADAGTTALLGLSVLLAISGAMGIAYAVFRTSAKTNTVELYARENTILTQANTRHESAEARLQAKVDSLTQANLTLQETVSGTAAVRHLASEIAREENARREEHMVMQTLLKDIISELRQSRGALGR